jgi:hypothetical protein
MIPRASLLAVCFFWMAYESHFSPQFFLDTVRASLLDMRVGLDTAMSSSFSNPAWHTASSE